MIHKWVEETMQIKLALSIRRRQVMKQNGNSLKKRVETETQGPCQEKGRN
jgi:hypothetical protein